MAAFGDEANPLKVASSTEDHREYGAETGETLTTVEILNHLMVQSFYVYTVYLSSDRLHAMLRTDSLIIMRLC